MNAYLVRTACWLCIAIPAAVAQPSLNPVNPVVNAASYMPAGMPSSAIAQGSIFAVFGTGLGPAAWTTPPAGVFPLPTTLAEVTVNVTVGGATASAILLGLNQYQINAILPSTTPTGKGSLTVTYNNAVSAAVPVQVTAAAFGIFTFGSSGVGQAIATDPKYKINTIIHTFHPGDVGIIWGTGLGPITASDAGLPPVGNLPGDIQVYVGNSTAQVGYHGRSGCCAGLDQITFTVPAGVEGCYVPLSVTTSGGSSNFTTIAVSASGQTCSDSILGSDLIGKLAAGHSVNFGYIRLEDGFLKFAQTSTIASIEDLATATFSEFTPGTAGMAEYGVSSGYCIAVPCPGGLCAVNGFASLEDMSPAQLDAGPSLNVSFGNNIPMPQVTSGYGLYEALLDANQRFLYAEEPYTVTGTGGTVVGAFSVTDHSGDIAAAFTNLGPLQALPRGSDLTLNWSGAETGESGGTVIVGGYSAADTTYNSLSYFQCTGSGASGQITIPARVLSLLPATGTGQNSAIGAYPLGWIWVGQYNNPTTFAATGLDLGIITDAFWQGYGVYFQ